MRAIVSKGSLVDALSRCALMTDKRSSASPGAGKVRLAATAGSIAYHATAIVIDVAGTLSTIELSGTGDFLINCAELLRSVQSMPDGGVALALANDVLTVSSGKRKFNIDVTAGEDAPMLHKPTGKARAFKGSDIAGLIRCVRHAVDGEDGPRNGVLVQHSGRWTNVVASDSRVAAVDRLETGAGDEFSAQVPSSMVDVIVATLDTDDDVLFSATKERIFCQHGTVTVSVARRDQEALGSRDIRQWIDQMATGTTRATADAEALRGSAGIVGSGSVQLKLSISKSAIGLSGKTASNRKAEDEVSCESDGEVEMRVDPARMTAAMKHLKGEVTMDVSTQLLVIRQGEYLCGVSGMVEV